MKTKTDFEAWWFNEGSAMGPTKNEDHHEHTRRICEIAWSNGADKQLDPVRILRNEVNCRIEHGAKSGGHLEHVQGKLDEILSQ